MRVVLQPSQPWMKITANVGGGEYNDFNGDNGNYADRPDVMLVGNHQPENGCHLRYPCSSWSNSPLLR